MSGDASAHLSLATEARLNLLRGDIEIEINATAMLLSIAVTYLTVGHDDRHEMAMSDARDRMRSALAATKRLMGEIRTAGIAAEANTEWREQRDGRRRA